MKLIFTKILIVLLLSSYNSHAQVLHHADSLDSKSSINFKKKAIVPLSLIGLGVLLNGSRLERQFNTFVHEELSFEHKSTVDDYVRHVPAIIMYSADILGAKAKNHWFDQTKYLFISNLVSGYTTRKLKSLTEKTRPNGTSRSFPSGHSTSAFSNASVLYNEFYESSPLLAYSGYAFATSTALFRMSNNRHWLSDVMVGAGIGILVTELVYYFEPLKNFNPFKGSKNITLIPQIDKENYGFYFSLRF
jgi:membrane-associated phospholipid phosphatase